MEYEIGSIVFDHPFAYVLLNARADSHCSACLRPAQNLQLCAGCHFARYCGRDCQRLAWQTFHKAECQRLKRVVPNLPMTEVFFISRVLDRLDFLAKHGDKFGWEKERKFEELMAHEEDIKEDVEEVKRFERLYEKLKRFRPDLPEIDKIFPVQCRIKINSHSLHNSNGVEIGMALDLGVSKYNHSCRPNVAMIFDGFRTMMRPLVQGFDVRDPSVAHIAYIDVGRSRFQRRKDMVKKWYFWCQCERCVDPADEGLTAIRCSDTSCTSAVQVSETTEAADVVCVCGKVVKAEGVAKAQKFMLAQPSTYVDVSAEELSSLLRQAEVLLHKQNIYLCRLLAAYSRVSGNTDKSVLDPDLQQTVYENYKRCFPTMDRHIGYQLLHLARTLIQAGRRREATPYAYEAMVIFEVCFGMEHPYYLQTLALWTFLDTNAQKTTEELLRLLDFNYNKPVDINAMLEHANPITP